MLYIAADHAGFKLKEKIKEFLSGKKIAFTDLGTNSEESVDYPDYAIALSKKVAASNGADEGILVCGTGIGMSITANKVKGVYAALVFNEFTAKSAREHNIVNVLCIGSRTTPEELALKIVDIWLTNPRGSEQRHLRRFDKIRDLESGKEFSACGCCCD